MANGLKLFYDLTLLEQGKYRDWFWLSLSPAAISWIKRPQCPLCRQTFYQANRKCNCEEERLTAVPAWVNKAGLAWRLKAACQGVDTQIFFPSNRAFANKPDAQWRQYCFDCPVTAHCKLEAADSHSVGVWGGEFLQPTNEKNRQKPTGTGLPGRPRKNAVT